MSGSSCRKKDFTIIMKWYINDRSFQKKDIEMMKKTSGSKVIKIGKFATVDDKPVDI